MITANVRYLMNHVSEDEDKEHSKIYGVHKYWSRKPWYPISKCIQKYSKEGDTVLDMFLGSGVTALESVLTGRNFVGFDLNPMSIFISENTLLTNFDEALFLKELGIIKMKLSPLADKLYSVQDTCSICGKNLVIQHVNLGPVFKDKEVAHIFCFDCGRKTKLVRLITKTELRMSSEPYELNKWVPTIEFPKKFYKDRFSYKGVRKVTDMYTQRNLYFLSELLDVIKTSNLTYKNLFLLAFSNTVLHASKLKGENVRPLNVNNYWIPDDYFEENPWFRFLERFTLIVKAKKILKSKIGTSNLGCCKLFNKSCFKTGLSNNSVDYIITDPPYGDAVQYSELSFMWNAWLGFEFDIEEEVVINPVQDKGINEFLNLLEKSVAEAQRVLKPGKRYTLCFHNKAFQIWKGVLDIFKKNDFVLEDVEIVDTRGHSYNKNWAEFSPKSDLYLTFIKSRYIPTHNKKTSIREMLDRVLSKCLKKDPSSIYDILSVNLINELYFNEYQIDISKLTIKKLGQLIDVVTNGN